MGNGSNVRASPYLIDKSPTTHMVRRLITATPVSAFHFSSSDSTIVWKKNIAMNGTPSPSKWNESVKSDQLPPTKNEPITPIPKKTGVIRATTPKQIFGVRIVRVGA